MKGSWKRLVSVVLGVSLLMSSAVQTSVLAQSPEAEGQTTDALALDYTIYPLVREKTIQMVDLIWERTSILSTQMGLMKPRVI